jgi:hypothetical protein
MDSRGLTDCERGSRTVAAPKGSARRREICRNAALARSASMSPARRSEICRNAVLARYARGWMGKSLPGEPT